jgi:hypothetical protein
MRLAYLASYDEDHESEDDSDCVDFLGMEHIFQSIRQIEQKEAYLLLYSNMW